MYSAVTKFSVPSWTHWKNITSYWAWSADGHYRDIVGLELLRQCQIEVRATVAVGISVGIGIVKELLTLHTWVHESAMEGWSKVYSHCCVDTKSEETQRHGKLQFGFSKQSHLEACMYKALTTFHCCHIPLPCLTTDWCPICRPHSDPVGCSWFQTTQCDTSGGPSHNPLILWSHHWGSSKVLSLITHIVSCSTRHLGPGDTHCCICSSSWCDGLWWGSTSYKWHMKVQYHQ